MSKHTPGPWHIESSSETAGLTLHPLTSYTRTLAGNVALDEVLAFYKTRRTL